MKDYFVKTKKDGFSLKLWRGERMCLLGFDVDDPEPDFVGFAVEYLEPDETKWKTLHNRLAFSYDQGINGWRTWRSTEAPIQKFRWIHFPWNPRRGEYSYRVTKIHRP